MDGLETRQQKASMLTAGYVLIVVYCACMVSCFPIMSDSLKTYGLFLQHMQPAELSHSSIHGILHARILEWVAIPSRGFPNQGQTFIS